MVLGCINCCKNVALDISVIEIGTPINSNDEKQQNKRKVYKKKSAEKYTYFPNPSQSTVIWKNNHKLGLAA